MARSLRCGVFLFFFFFFFAVPSPKRFKAEENAVEERKFAMKERLRRIREYDQEVRERREARMPGSCSTTKKRRGKKKSAAWSHGGSEGQGHERVGPKALWRDHQLWNVGGQRYEIFGGEGDSEEGDESAPGEGEWEQEVEYDEECLESSVEGLELERAGVQEEKSFSHGGASRAPQQPGVGFSSNVSCILSSSTVDCVQGLSLPLSVFLMGSDFLGHFSAIGGIHSGKPSP